MKMQGFGYRIKRLSPSPLGLLALWAAATAMASYFYFSVAAAADTAAPVLMEGAQGYHFVDNKTCIKCHAEQAQDWLGSDHEKAMQKASKQTVLGNFADITFTDAGVTSRFFQKENKYFVNTLGPAGKYADFEVKYTFGVKPLQQYLLALPKGRLQAFTVAWNSEKKQWFDLYPGEAFKPGTPLHWSGRAFTANSYCMECHMTNMSLNYDVKAGEYHTQWSELNVSCQACHGPGSAHVKWAQDKQSDNPRPGSKDKGLIVNYQAMTPQGQVESCARCHSRRYSVSENDTHGRSFFDDFMPELLREGAYHADGQILDEVYVYGSFIQSKMYHSGVGCMDCHNPHTLKVRDQGNGLCVRCHQEKRPSERFASLQAKNYQTPKHHFHKSDAAGARCVNCHMPETTYMEVDPRRDHSFSIPRPDLSKKWGVPNACTQCHSDKTIDWAITAMNQWYGQAWQERPSIAGVISQARAGAAETMAPLIQLIKNTKNAAIVRATALDLLPRYGPAGLNVALDSLTDASPLVRAAALRGLELLPERFKVKAVASLLGDPVQGVRIEAANLLAAIPKQSFTEEEQRQLERALSEYKSAQMALSDQPQGHLNLGNLYARIGQADPAEQAYRTAIELAPYFSPGYSSLANLYYANGRKKEAANTFRKGLKWVPDSGDLHYSLSLLLVEQKQTEAAVEHLGKAAGLMPEQAKVHYNHGLLLQKLHRMAEAEKALLQAYELAPDDRRTLIALVALYKQQGQLKKSEKFINMLRSKGRR